MWLAIFSVLAAVMPAARAWPQAIRIVRRNDVSGVSLLTWSLVLANFTIWSYYGVVLALPVLIMANTLAGIGAISVLIGLARHGVSSYLRIPAIVIGMTGISFTCNTLISDALVWALATALAVSMFIPQVFTAFRQNPTGISPTTWWLGIVAGVVWAGYGFAVHEPQLAAPHLVMTPCAIAILLRIYTFKTIYRPVPIPPVESLNSEST